MEIRLKDRNDISQEPMRFDDRSAKRPTILVFDSGVGGLSIYAEVRETLPNANYLYVFDNEAFPYGEKTDQFIVDRVIAIIGAIYRQHTLDLVIVACNTASTISLSALRAHFLCPIIGVVPAVKPSASLTRNGIVGLLATRATIHRSYTHDLISQFAGNCQILHVGTGEMVDIAEAKLHGEIVSLPVLHKLLRPLLRATKPPDTVVLGCTHFPLLSQELKMVLPKGTHLVDSCSAIARRAAWLLKHDMYMCSLQRNRGMNTAYCLITTPKVLALIPALTRYGFGSLRKLTI